MILAALLSMTMLSTQAQARSYSLEECFVASLGRSEVIAQQTTLIDQAEEKYNQSKAALFPTINGVASYQMQEAPGNSTAANFAPTEQTTVKLTATQPLFHGMREYATILQQNLQTTAAMAAKRQAAVQLYNDLASSFYTVLQLEQDMRNLQNEIDIDKKRIVDLNARIRIGRSRRSEVLLIISEIDTLVATYEATKGQLLVQRETLAFLTGFNRDVVIEEKEKLAASPDVLTAYLDRIDDRPDVKAARDNLGAVEKGIAIAKGGHLPTIDASAEYFFKRPGPSKDQHWDLLLSASLPIFAGGAVNSQIRQAVAATRQNELELQRVRRSADQQIRSAYESVVADIANVKGLDKATSSSFENYREQNRDYKLGLVTNLDVLQAIRSSQDALRALDRAKFQTKLDFLKLEAAAAKRPSRCGEGPNDAC